MPGDNTFPLSPTKQETSLSPTKQETKNTIGYQATSKSAIKPYLYSFPNQLFTFDDANPFPQQMPHPNITFTYLQLPDPIHLITTTNKTKI